MFMLASFSLARKSHLSHRLDCGSIQQKTAEPESVRPIDPHVRVSKFIQNGNTRMTERIIAASGDDRELGMDRGQEGPSRRSIAAVVADL
jgi:hypothetical protein